MAIADSVVTPQRFAQGLSYCDFLERALVNRDKFEQYYRTTPLSEEDLSFFRKAAAARHGMANILAIGEAWCGDVYRELPTVVRIAEATGVNLRIFVRDENPDIMDEFLSHGGKARAIPVFVFYTSGMQYITHFIERPASAQIEIDAILGAVRDRLNLPATATFTHLPEAASEEVIARILPRFTEWQKDSIQEMRELLSSALHLPNN
jgi:hypothetical protein